MRELKIIEHTLLDGVIQHTAAGDDLPWSDWTAPYRSPLDGMPCSPSMARASTCAWPTHRRYRVGHLAKAPRSPMGDGIPAATKFIATHRPESLEWGQFEGLGPDLVEDVRRIKARDGPDPILSGSSTLTSALLDHGLADEVWLAVSPVLLGAGKRFFAESTPAHALELIGTRAFPSGIHFNTHKLTGRMKTGSFIRSGTRGTPPSRAQRRVRSAWRPLRTPCRCPH